MLQVRVLLGVLLHSCETFRISARFEVLLNGERLCISGLSGDGVLAADVNYVQHANKDGSYRLHIGGLGRFLPSHERDHHADWPSREIGIGDEITFRILAPGEFDVPQNMLGSPVASITDPLFGDLDYNISAWAGELAIDLPRLRPHVFNCGRMKMALLTRRSSVMAILLQSTTRFGRG